MAAPPDFIAAVVAARDLVVTTAHDHVWWLAPRQSDLAWHCELDDGTPTSNENDPAAHVRWVCPSLRLPASTSESVVRTLDVRRLGPKSDLDRLVRWFGRLSGGESESESQERFAYTDPAGVLDDALRHRIEHWPSAMHGDGVVRPAELLSIKIRREGLVVESASWWGSAEALDHQLALATDIADRLAGV